MPILNALILAQLVKCLMKCLRETYSLRGSWLLSLHRMVCFKVVLGDDGLWGFAWQICIYRNYPDLYWSRLCWIGQNGSCTDCCEALNMMNLLVRLCLICIQSLERWRSHVGCLIPWKNILKSRGMQWFQDWPRMAFTGKHMISFSVWRKKGLDKSFTLVSVSKAVGQLGDGNKCKFVYTSASELGVEFSVLVGTALVLICTPNASLYRMQDRFLTWISPGVKSIHHGMRWFVGILSLKWRSNGTLWKCVETMYNQTFTLIAAGSMHLLH